MKHYQLIGLLSINIAEEPMHDELENVYLFFET